MAAVVSKLSFALGKQLFISCQASFCKVKKPLAKLWPYTFLPSNKHWGPLHVVWQVSFGWWITWSISSWQNSYKSVFFPKAEWWVFLNDKICSYTKKKLFGTWQFGKIGVLVNFIIQKFAKLKSKHFSHFFLLKGKSERIE